MNFTTFLYRVYRTLSDAHLSFPATYLSGIAEAAVSHHHARQHCAMESLGRT
jgi:hypothetical protein